MYTTMSNNTTNMEDLYLARSQSVELKAAKRRFRALLVGCLCLLVLFDSYHVVLAEKGRDIIIYNGKVILKGSKKKGSIIISNGDHGEGQGKYKYKKKYMNYGGFWRR